MTFKEMVKKNSAIKEIADYIANNSILENEVDDFVEYFCRSSNEEIYYIYHTSGCGNNNEPERIKPIGRENLRLMNNLDKINEKFKIRYGVFENWLFEDKTSKISIHKFFNENDIPHKFNS